ncbi:septal ring lytic transglycosylase RlpA family protein [Streptomyces hygroscopicus]|uniref:septal ring lytic transglycosylase RlpA family protein n=1 Tax=Streptomyces hygroscopicus TaxID=1912 RepID=UPI00224017D0|nr:septal ring lytic transglycosylase RlpA family protein [Streptomyces hygroscopicus]
MSRAIPLARPAAGVAALCAALVLAPTSSAASGGAQPGGGAAPVAPTCWATHYGPMPPGALTASGEVFDNNKNTAATSLTRNPQLPFGARVRVTNVANGRSLVVRINDRGTFQQTPQEPKCLDLTDGAFGRLGGSLDPDAGHIVVTQQVLS